MPQSRRERVEVRREVSLLSVYSPVIILPILLPPTKKPALAAGLVMTHKDLEPVTN